MALLEVHDLVTEFPTRKGVVRAVDGVTFDLERGEILAVVGESGSGKSVTSLSIMGLLQDPGHVAGGSITFDGKDLLAASEAEMEWPAARSPSTARTSSPPRRPRWSRSAAGRSR